LVKLKWLVLAATGLALAACANKGTPSGPRVFASDLAGGAKSCSAPAPALKDGGEAQSEMKVGNDGGWCGITVSKDGKPYAAGLLTGMPAHGKVLIHTVGDDTRIDYTPDRGYAGPDQFTVTLLPGETALRVSVTVTTVS
jgi:hypothetical protein